MPTISEALAVATQHHQAGRLDLAEAIYRRILAVEPQHAAALHQVGLAAHQQGQQAAAIDAIRRAIDVDPTQAPFHNSLGEAYRASGMPAVAAPCYRRALELAPDYAEAHYNLGLLLQQGRLDEQAIGHYRRALELNPGLAVAHNNLGVLLLRRGDDAEAVASFHEAARLEPGFVDALNNLACAQRDQGELDQSLATYRRAVALAPHEPGIASNMLLAMHYLPRITPDELSAAYRHFDEQYALPLRATWRPHENDRDPDRRLRLGFVSGDFERHPVGYFCLRAMENLRGAGGEVVCFSTRACHDDFTARFRAAADVWREVPDLCDEALAEQIRADRVDVLFDLAAHASWNRLPVFARKPAPIQVAWAGPTGVSAIDYILTDAQLVPAGAEGHYREAVLRMPDGYACFDPPGEAPAVGPLPAQSRGYVTFGSLNNLAKITPEVIGVWGRILQRVPNSRLLIRYGTAAANPRTRDRLRDCFAGEGVDCRRVDFVGGAPYAERFDLFGEIDLALDPFPFSGCTTTCEALWMGVPVITCPGETYLSRQSLSHLHSVGLQDPVASDLGDYVDRAVALAGDLPRLALLRAGLREQMAASPLCDGGLFARNLMQRLHDAWRVWCLGSERT
jgi:predicted O-linked N-acetylglucosamine transferase (SPINDLY family)